jgi:predicted nucleic acid-binding protein
MDHLILDTNVLIAVERGSIDLDSFPDDTEIAVAAITVAEYRVGIELADTAARSAARSRFLAALVADIDILDYSETTAIQHARLLAHVRRSGLPRGAHDLIIAAHAAETGRTIVSRDAKARFADLPGVQSVEP